MIEAAALIEHAKSLSHAANEAEERRLVGETLKAFLDSHDTKSAQVCVGMPGRLALSRPLESAADRAGQGGEIRGVRGRYQFPFPLEQLSWDFQFFDGPPPASNWRSRPADKEGRRALLIGAKRTATQRFLETFQRLGLRVECSRPISSACTTFSSTSISIAAGRFRGSRRPPPRRWRRSTSAAT